MEVVKDYLLGKILDNSNISFPKFMLLHISRIGIVEQEKFFKGVCLQEEWGDG